MAVWKQTVAGVEVRILNVDHPPPHCHAWVNGRDLAIDLRTMRVRNPPPHEMPTSLRRALVRLQDELLQAWEDVVVVPPGSSPGVW